MLGVVAFVGVNPRSNGLLLACSLPEATQDDLAMPLTAAQRGDALEQVLCSIYEVYVVEPALVARVLPHLQEDLLSLGKSKWSFSKQCLKCRGECQLVMAVGS